MDIAYDFSTRAADETEISDRAQLDGIMLVRTEPSERAARLEWRAAVDSASAAYGAPLRCEQIRGNSPGLRAVWRVDGALLDVSARGPLTTGTEVVPDRVIFTVTTKEDRNNLEDVSEVPCSSVGG